MFVRFLRTGGLGEGKGFHVCGTERIKKLTGVQETLTVGETLPSLV